MALSRLCKKLLYIICCFAERERGIKTKSRKKNAFPHNSFMRYINLIPLRLIYFHEVSRAKVIKKSETTKSNIEEM